MLLAAIILGWIGIFMFLVIIFTFQKLAESNEYAFIHLLMALMYGMWFPLPMMLYKLIEPDIVLVGAVFGLAYLLSIVISMTLQTGHIAFITKHNENQAISDKLGEYMMTTLSNPFESLLGVFKSIWAIFLSIAFYQSGELWMAGLMLPFSLLIFYYLLIMLDASLVKRIKVLSKVKPNPYIVNVETLCFFLVLMSYLTFGVKL